MSEPKHKNLLQRAGEVWHFEGLPGVIRRAKRYLSAAFPGLEDRRWLKLYTPDAAELESMRQRAADFSYRPRISVILPVYNPSREHLCAALDSVLGQVYSEWELCIADDASTEPFVREVLEDYRQRDCRVRVVFRKENGHISHSSNSALSLASGEFVALLDHDDVLAPHALFEMVRVLNEEPDLDLLYSNEDKLTERGKRVQPTFKASWSPEYFLSFMYIGHLKVFRKSLVESVGGFRPGFEGSQDYDLALRVTEQTDKVRHVPKILYHWRMHEDSVAGNIHAKPYAFRVAKKALQEALRRRGIARPQVLGTAQRLPPRKPGSVVYDVQHTYGSFLIRKDAQLIQRTMPHFP